jgi:prepilin peptidase CpaA
MLMVYGFTIVAVIMDIRFRRISNRLIVIGLGVGLIRRLLLEGGAGLFAGVIQIILPVIFLYLFFLIGALGAGDIKLFSLIGGFVNFKELVTCVIAAFVIGAIWSLLRLFITGICRLLQAKEEEASRKKEHTIPFGVAIFFGLLVATV